MAEAPKFTPGPWAARPDGCLVQQAKGDLAFIRLASPWIEGAFSADNDDEVAANMALMAAAPELYAALNDTLALALLQWGNLDPDANKVFAAAHAALAKARAMSTPANGEG